MYRAYPAAPALAPVVLASLGAMRSTVPSSLRLGPHRGLGQRGIVLMSVLTLSTAGSPDPIHVCPTIMLVLHAAHETWEVNGEERLAARASSGEAIA